MEQIQLRYTELESGTFCGEHATNTDSIVLTNTGWYTDISTIPKADRIECNKYHYNAAGQHKLKPGKWCKRIMEQKCLYRQISAIQKESI
jgi:hypothetical protein